MEQFHIFQSNTTMICSLPHHDETILGYCLKCETEFCVNCLIKDKNHSSHLEDCKTLKEIVKDFQGGRYDIQKDKEQLVKQIIEDQEEIKKIQTTFISNPEPAIDRLQKILNREEWMIQQDQIYKEQIEMCFKQFSTQICFDQKFIAKTIKTLYKFLNNREKFFEQIQELIIRTKEKVYKKIDQQEIIKKYIEIQKKLKQRVEQMTYDLFCSFQKILSSKYLQEQQNDEFQQYWLKSFFEQDFPQIFSLQQKQTEGIIKFLIEQMINNKNISSFLILGLKMIDYYTTGNCSDINENYYRSLILFYKQFKSIFDFQNNHDSGIEIIYQQQKINVFVKSTLKKLDYYQYPFQISQKQNVLVFYYQNQISNNLNSPQILFNISLIGKVPCVKFNYETKYLKIFIDQLINKYSSNIQILLLNMEIDSKLFHFILDIFHIKLINNLLLPKISNKYIENKVKPNEFYQQIEIQESNSEYNEQENLYDDKDQSNFNQGNDKIIIQQKLHNEFNLQLLLHRTCYLFTTF